MKKRPARASGPAFVLHAAGKPAAVHRIRS